MTDRAALWGLGLVLVLVLVAAAARLLAPGREGDSSGAPGDAAWYGTAAPTAVVALTLTAAGQYMAPGAVAGTPTTFAISTTTSGGQVYIDASAPNPRSSRHGGSAFERANITVGAGRKPWVVRNVIVFPRGPGVSPSVETNILGLAPIYEGGEPPRHTAVMALDLRASPTLYIWGPGDPSPLPSTRLAEQCWGAYMGAYGAEATATSAGGQPHEVYVRFDVSAEDSYVIAAHGGATAPFGSAVAIKFSGGAPYAAQLRGGVRQDRGWRWRHPVIVLGRSAIRGRVLVYDHADATFTLLGPAAAKEGGAGGPQ